MADEEKRVPARPGPQGAQRDRDRDQYGVASANRKEEDHVSSVPNNRGADRGWRGFHGWTCRSGDEEIRRDERRKHSFHSNPAPDEARWIEPPRGSRSGAPS